MSEIIITPFDPTLVDTTRGDNLRAERARDDEIKVSQFITDIETAMRGKTFAQISTFIDNMTTEQRDRAFKGLLLKWALEVK